MVAQTMTYSKAGEVLRRYLKWKNMEKVKCPTYQEVDKALSLAIETLETLAEGGIVETEEKKKLRRLYEFVLSETEEK